MFYLYEDIGVPKLLLKGNRYEVNEQHSKLIAKELSDWLFEYMEEFTVCLTVEEKEEQRELIKSYYYIVVKA